MTDHLNASPDAVIIGGGVIGLAVAWRVAQRGLRVTLLERDRFGAGTSRVAAGMIAPISEARNTERMLLALGLASARAYPAFVEELVQASGHDPRYLACGTIAAARDQDDAEALQRELELRGDLGLPVRRLLATEARRLEPGIAPVLRLALEVPDDHAIDPRELTAALAQACAIAGVDLRAGVAAAEVLSSGDRIAGVRLADHTRVLAEQVVVAAGVWSGELGGLPDGARVPVRPVKGQIMRLHDPAGPGLLTRALRMQGSGYVVPRGDGRYVLGATMEERGFDTSVTAGPLFELLRDAIELLPGLSELVIDELIAGLRPSTPDNAPALGPGAITGLQWATGHHRHGILLAPITAEILAAALAGEPPTELAAAFTPARFDGAAVGSPA
ncbi:MAG TPA: glycine oxidase ThiO [Solirubrobacteraceae bacterium]|nr:glycine oxidase ThiO [Solirubrobacteraceae bacterium]